MVLRGWVAEESRRKASLCVEKAELSGELTPAAWWVGMEGGWVIGHAKSFRLLK